MKKKKIVTMGFMGQMPIAGVVWQHIHYIVGLMRLGHEVYYIEDTLNPCYNPQTFEWSTDLAYAAKILRQLAEKNGFQDRWCFCQRQLPGHPTAGLSKQRMLELYREADAIVNICGAQEFNDDILQNNRILYVESDPGIEQIRVDQGKPDTLPYLRRHHALFTFGELIGSGFFPVPLHDLKWLPTRQPVVTDLWKTASQPGGAAVFTSIANWSTAGTKDVEWRGSTYLWSKSLEFLKFVQAPALSGEEFELATTIKDRETLDTFRKNRWRFSSPVEISINFDQYRDYIQASKGEFTVAKDVYARLNTGWFSDRSACYLAAGRPVITQETGFTKIYGGNKGLLAFRTADEIEEHVRAINADYKAHSRAAFEIAAEYFEATKVLASLLDRAGV
jgi:hypothetical protein